MSNDYCTQQLKNCLSHRGDPSLCIQQQFDCENNIKLQGTTLPSPAVTHTIIYVLIGIAALIILFTLFYLLKK